MSGQRNAVAAIASATTDGAVVAAVAARIIRVTSYVLSPATTATACTFTSKPAGSGVAKSAVITTATGTPFSSGYNPEGWFDCVVGEGLSLTTGTGSTVGVQVTYTLV